VVVVEWTEGSEVEDEGERESESEVGTSKRGGKPFLW